MQIAYDKQDAIPEALREFFVEHNGKFLHRDVVGLERHRDQVLGEKKALAERLRGFEGVDPEEYAKLKIAQAEAERKKAEGEGNWKALESQLVQKHQADLQKEQAERQAIHAALEKAVIDADLTRAITAAGGVPELLLPVLRSQIQMNEKYQAVVMDKDGRPRIGDSQGSPMTVDQLVEEARQHAVYGRAFNPSGGAGSGAPAMSNGQLKINPATLNPTQKIAFGLSKSR